MKKTVSLLLLLSLSFQTFSWGFFAHRAINRLAVFTLPYELLGFYKEHIQYITDNAVNPDKRRYAIEGEAVRHYLDTDHYEHSWPIDTIPRTWEEAIEKFSEDTLLTYGIVPWHVLVMKNKLTKAFQEKNVEKIIRISADLGHYIGDMHVPLHSTENYNGQLTNQKGIHGLWESRIPELFAEDNYDFFVGNAFYIEDPLNSVWDRFGQSFAAKDTVLNLEKEITKQFTPENKYSYENRLNTVTRVYSKEFCDAYQTAMNNMVERRMNETILYVGAMWYTCWIDAGKPDLQNLKYTPSETIATENGTLDGHYHEGKAKGRVCN